MPNNRGTTSLKCKRRSATPMSDYDRLPAPLRHWVAKAALPWRAKSVQKAYDKALRRTGHPAQALLELDRLQAGLLTKDASHVWGNHYPTEAWVFHTEAKRQNRRRVTRRA